MSQLAVTHARATIRIRLLSLRARSVHPVRARNVQLVALPELPRTTRHRHDRMLINAILHQTLDHRVCNMQKQGSTNINRKLVEHNETNVDQ